MESTYREEPAHSHNRGRLFTVCLGVNAIRHKSDAAHQVGRIQDQVDNRTSGTHDYLQSAKCFDTPRCLEWRPRRGSLPQQTCASGTRGPRTPERFVVRWHGKEAEENRQRHAFVMGGALR